MGLSAVSAACAAAACAAAAATTLLIVGVEQCGCRVNAPRPRCVCVESGERWRRNRGRCIGVHLLFIIVF